MLHRRSAVRHGIPKIQSMSIVDNKRLSSIISSKTATRPGWSWKAGRSRPSAPAGWASSEAYVRVIRSQVWLVGANISPAQQRFHPIRPDAIRMRRCLLHQGRNQQTDRQGSREKGYTLIPINLHFSKGRVKLEIGLAKGKKDHDKRAAIKDRENQQDAADAMKKAG